MINATRSSMFFSCCECEYFVFIVEIWWIIHILFTVITTCISNGQDNGQLETSITIEINAIILIIFTVAVPETGFPNHSFMKWTNILFRLYSWSFCLNIMPRRRRIVEKRRGKGRELTISYKSDDMMLKHADLSYKK